jgi:ABC-type transport system involved in multi-copper enzyme maturation permease subunit
MTTTTTTTRNPSVPPGDAASSAQTFPGIPFSRLIRVEWGKATETRAARWLLAAVAATTVGLMLVPILSPSTIDQTYTSYLSYAATGLSILLPVVAILTLTSEWSQRTVLTTFTQEPRRMRIVTAKVTVSLMLGAGAAAFGGLVTAAGLAAAAASGRTLDADLDTGLVFAFLLYVLINVMTGVALGALVHNSAVAIVLSFALPIAFALLGQASQVVADWLDYTTAFTWLLNGQWSGHTTQILVSIALWIAAPMTVGLIRTVRREIN